MSNPGLFSLFTPQKGSKRLQNDDFDHFHFKSEPMKGEIHTHLEETVRPYIDLIDNLRSVDIQKDLALPIIAVIGDQSSGKSSVLEALSGVALPRGTGIVTRCPLELRLKKVVGVLNWRAVLSYRGRPEVDIVDPSLVEKHIREAQDEIAGRGVGISDELITLEVMSPDVCDLTLIDLPGITRVPVDGQPQDIGNKIKKLILKFIEKQETIIMVVVPCNTDIATTEALKMAQEVDPEGKRTLAILTKPDLIDPGTEKNVLAIAQNQVIRLSKGYCMVKCRGQQHINENVSLEEATRMEEDFFRTHKDFRYLLAEEKATVKCLSVKLTKHLVKHIKKSLPQLNEDIKKQLWNANNELKKIGDGPPQDPKGAKRFLTQILDKFNDNIKILSKGEQSKLANILAPCLKEQKKNLFFYLRTEFSTWKKELHNSKTSLLEAIEKLRGEYDSIRGRQLPGFSDYDMFETILQNQLVVLKHPATELLSSIKGIILKRFFEVSNEHFQNYPRLRNITENKIENIQSSQQAKAELRISEQFEMENIIYTQDDIFLTILRDFPHKKYFVEDWCSPAGSDEEMAGLSFTAQDAYPVTTPQRRGKRGMEFSEGQLPIFDIQSKYSEMMQTYYKIVVQRAADQLPLIILFFMLKESARLLSTDMLTLLDEANISELLSEDSESSKRRKDLQNKLDRLTKGQEALNNFM